MACEDVQRHVARLLTGDTDGDASGQSRMGESQHRWLIGHRMPLIPWQQYLKAISRTDKLLTDHMSHRGAATGEAHQRQATHGEPPTGPPDTAALMRPTTSPFPLGSGTSWGVFKSGAEIVRFNLLPE